MKTFIDSLLSFLKEIRKPIKKEDAVTSGNMTQPFLNEIKIGDELESAILSDSIKLTINEDDVCETTSFSEAIDTIISVDKGINFEENMISFSRIMETKEESVAEKEENEKKTEESTTEAFPISLLDNKPFAKLAEECVDLMNEFEGYIDRLETAEGKMIVEMLEKRFQEILERSGLQRIDNENEPFSVLRHTPVPMEPVSEGIALSEIICPGLLLENRVLRKAKVKI